MVRSEIVEGLKVALHKGESLKDAMLSFYNAGYSKKDIEEAARNLHLQQDTISREHQIQHKVDQKPKKHFKPFPTSTSSVGLNRQSNLLLEEKKTQPGFSSSPKHPLERHLMGDSSGNQVSNYDSDKPKSHKLLIITLILTAVIILGFISAYFLFQEQLLDFFKNLFG